MNKFGIKIDLSSYFDDERKLVFVMVDPDWKTIAALQSRVEKMFQVANVRFLVDEISSYISPEESIEILKFCKGLRAFIPKESLEKHKKKKKKAKRRAEDTSQDDKSSDDVEEVQAAVSPVKANSEESMKKRKYRQDKELKNTPANKAKRVKSTNSKSTEITSTSEQLPMAAPQPLLIVSEKKKKHSSPRAESQESLVEFNNDHKGRCKNLLSSTMLNEGEPSKVQKSKQSNPFKNPRKPKSGHMYFNESGEMVTTTTTSIVNTSAIKSAKSSENINDTAKVNIVFKCDLNEANALGEAPRVFHSLKNQSKTNEIETTKTKSSSPKKVVEIREQIILSPASTKGLYFINKSNNSSADNQLQNSELHDNTKNASECEEQLPDNDTSLLPLNESESTGNTAVLNSQNISASKLGQSILQSSAVDCSLNVENESSCIQNEKSKLADNSSMSISISDNCDEPSSEDLSNNLKEQEEDEDTSGIIDDKTSPIDDSNISQIIHDSSESDIEEIPEVIDLNDSEDVGNRPSLSSENATLEGNSLLVEEDDLKIDKILPFCTQLKEETKIDDIIVFKLPCFIKGQHQRKLTNYMLGKIEYINRRTKVQKILILDGLSEFSRIPLQFHINLDESQSDLKYLQLKLSDMQQLKIYNPTN